MSINKKQLSNLNSDYESFKGGMVKKFVCPITLLDDPDAELCDGHVLNKSIGKASSAKVIQRKDVDNYFGHSIEPELVKMLNIPISKPLEIMRKSRNLALTAPDGKKISAFFGKSKARERFQQINLFDTDGETFASPFLKNGRLEHKYYNDLLIECDMKIKNFAVIGSIIKSGYLALFRIFGYRWIFSNAGEKVRRPLSNFFHDKANKEHSAKYFADFEGSYSIILNSEFNVMEDTLEGGSLLFHCTKFDHNLFALTCLFRVNNQMISVTLPYCQVERLYLDTVSYYRTFLKNRSMPHNVYYGQYKNGRILIFKYPFRLKINTKKL